MCSVSAVNAELKEQVVEGDAVQVMPSAIRGKTNRYDSVHGESLMGDGNDRAEIGGIGGRSGSYESELTA